MMSTSVRHWTASRTQVQTQYLDQLHNLATVAAGARPENNTVEEALIVQRVIDAIYRSSESGRATQLAEPQLKQATRLH